MKILEDFSNVFTRYDLNIEVARQEARKVSKDALLQKVADTVVAGETEDCEAATKAALGSKSPMEVINNGLIPGMNEVSRLWDEGMVIL